MELGLYNLKYPFRKLISFLLPFYKNSDPNRISLSLIWIGLFTALIYYLAALTPWLYILGAILIFVRMIVGTLDGLVAVTYKKESANGEILNRLAPEVADMFLMIALILNCQDYLLGVMAVIMCWLISYTGLIGIVGKKAIQSVGPAGQTDRIAVLIVLSILACIGAYFGWSVNFVELFLYWVIFGGIWTVFLRCRRVLSGPLV